MDNSATWHAPDSAENALVHIEPLGPDAVERVSALAREIWWKHYPGIIGAAQIEYMLRQRYEPSIIRAELQRNDIWWAKLALGEETIGFSSCFLTGEPGEMKLDKLYVHPQRQRQGYGGMLIEHACAVARAHGCSRLVLAVNKANRNAIAAYGKHGFEIGDSIVKDIGGGFVMDDYVMVRKI